MLSRIGEEIGDLLALLRNLLIFVTVAAVYKELRTPPAQRTWNGRLFGVPYDFRLPNLPRLRDAYWNTESDEIFTDRPLGVGWAVNLPPILRQVGLMNERRPASGGAAPGAQGAAGASATPSTRRRAG